jgi:DNA invertase Pin-like site-specific DNA recombinase
VSAYTVDYTDRVQLMRMLDAAKQRKFTVLVVSEIRALGRKQAEIFVIYNQLQKYGVRLETVQEKFEDSAMGRLMLSLVQSGITHLQDVEGWQQFQVRGRQT